MFPSNPLCNRHGGTLLFPAKDISLPNFPSKKPLEFVVMRFGEIPCFLANPAFSDKG